METIAADTIFVIILVRKGVHVCIRRHCLVEGSIEYADLRDCRKDCRNSLDAEDVCRVVERREYRALLELRNHLVSDELAAYELLCTMHDTMSYGLDILKSIEHAIFLVKEGIHDRSDGYSMVLDRHFLNERFLSGRLMLEATCFHSDSFDKTLGDEIVDLVALHIKKLILKR
jgi:hypothetical protein